MLWPNPMAMEYEKQEFCHDAKLIWILPETWMRWFMDFIFCMRAKMEQTRNLPWRTWLTVIMQLIVVMLKTVENDDVSIQHLGDMKQNCTRKANWRTVWILVTHCHCMRTTSWRNKVRKPWKPNSGEVIVLADNVIHATNITQQSVSPTEVTIVDMWYSWFSKNPCVKKCQKYSKVDTRKIWCGPYTAFARCSWCCATPNTLL